MVDVLGGFDDAVKIAAQMADIEDDYKVRYYPTQKTFFEQLMSDFNQEVETKIMKAQMGDFYPYFQQYQKIKQHEGIQARLPYDLEIK